MHVQINVPQELRNRPPSLHGEWIAHHGQIGRVLCGAGNGGAWIDIGGKYIGCPLEYLVRCDANL